MIARATLIAAVLLGAASAAAARPQPVLVSVTPLAAAPAGAAAYRIHYRSTDYDGRPRITTAAVFVPRGPAPAGGRPVIAWAHGTSGVNEHCSLSDSPALEGSVAGLAEMLGNGYIVAATDYAGLGSKGPHAYLVGPAAAHDVIDAVRAVREMPRAQAGSRYVVWGESQGGHTALWTGQAAARDNSGLQLIGVAAAAPPTDLKQNLAGGTNAAVKAFLTAYTAASWTRVYHVPLSTIARPVGADLIRRIANNCVSLDGFKLGTKIGLVRLSYALRNVDLAASPAWGPLLARNSVQPFRYGVPLLVAQGQKDVIVSPDVTRQFIRRQCRQGDPLKLIQVEGGDHVTIAKRTATETVAWIGDRFAGRPAPNDCGGA